MHHIPIIVGQNPTSIMQKEKENFKKCISSFSSSLEVYRYDLLTYFRKEGHEVVIYKWLSTPTFW